MPQVHCHVHKSHTTGSFLQLDEFKSLFHIQFKPMLYQCSWSKAGACAVSLWLHSSERQISNPLYLFHLSIILKRNVICKLQNMPLGSRAMISQSVGLLYYAWDDRGSIPGVDKSTLALRPTKDFILLVLRFFPKAVKAWSSPLTIVMHIKYKH